MLFLTFQAFKNGYTFSYEGKRNRERKQQSQGEMAQIVLKFTSLAYAGWVEGGGGGLMRSMNFVCR